MPMSLHASSSPPRLMLWPVVLGLRLIRRNPGKTIGVLALAFLMIATRAAAAKRRKGTA
jgi:hypothetical protein